MSVLDEREMNRLENMAGLRLEPEEREQLRVDLERVLGYFQLLQNMEGSGAKPLSRVAQQPEAWREDRVEPSLPRTEVLGQVQEAWQGYFAVPPVQEGREKKAGG